jgi:hypothetical protein
VLCNNFPDCIGTLTTSEFSHPHPVKGRKEVTVSLRSIILEVFGIPASGPRPRKSAVADVAISYYSRAKSGQNYYSPGKTGKSLAASTLELTAWVATTSRHHHVPIA